MQNIFSLQSAFTIIFNYISNNVYLMWLVEWLYSIYAPNFITLVFIWPSYDLPCLSLHSRRWCSFWVQSQCIIINVNFLSVFENLCVSFVNFPKIMRFDLKQLNTVIIALFLKKMSCTVKILDNSQLHFFVKIKI